jgi:predicted nucleotidyltransferase
MTNTLLDFSQRTELEPCAAVVADVETAAASLGVSTIVVGAFARDLHLVYGHGIDTQRGTEDLDFAFAVDGWSTFEALLGRLIDSGAFTAPAGAAHRLLHRTGTPIDLVPFGTVESVNRHIAWPPRGEVVMNVFGFQESFASSLDVLLPGRVRTRVVSLPALALLKIVCWQDRHYQSPGKDAHDLRLIIRNYLGAGNESRLWDEFIHWTQAEEFDYEFAAARMLGHDIKSLLGATGIARLAAILAEQASRDVPAQLPAEMMPEESERARSLLGAMLEGLSAR